LDDAENTMALFSKDSGDDKGLNVHDMQCMWYEVETGNSLLRQGRYREAVKQFTYVANHFEQIYEDQFDFHLYAIRKFTINSYFQMIDMEDKVYKNKYAVAAAIGLLKVAKKVSKLDLTQEKEKLKPLVEEYKASKEYQQLLDEQKKRDDDDEYKHDMDPKGYDLYEKFLVDPLGRALEFAQTVARYNP
jgi:peptide alpha-N-acetyltransferase